MATSVIMPRQGQSVESCIIAKWYKRKGEPVQAGELLFSYETDKASFDEEAKVSGVLLQVFFAEGDDVPCLTTVCIIGDAGEKVEDASPQVPAEATVPADVKEGERIKISPRAKHYAEKAGVDYRFAVPTGPHGRVVEKDIVTLQESGYIMTPAAKESFAEAGAVHPLLGTGLGGRITTADLSVKAAEMQATPLIQSQEPLYEEVKLTNIRKVIAKAMHHSISSTCQLTLNTSFDATAILEFRKGLKDSKDKLGLENITLNDMILFAVSRTLQSHKALNAHFMDDRMLYFKNVNLGLAVDTDRGLMVPVVFKADQKSLNGISKEVKALARECQSGAVNPDLMKNGSFTVTNLGTLGIESFTPILNPPQTGILGVNTIFQRAREKDGVLEFYPAMGLSLTFDHRALDGAPAARFLQDLVTNLENFGAMLAL